MLFRKSYTSSAGQTAYKEIFFSRAQCIEQVELSWFREAGSKYFPFIQESFTF